MKRFLFLLVFFSTYFFSISQPIELDDSMWELANLSIEKIKTGEQEQVRMLFPQKEEFISMLKANNESPEDIEQVKSQFEEGISQRVEKSMGAIKEIKASPDFELSTLKLDSAFAEGTPEKEVDIFLICTMSDNIVEITLDDATYFEGNKYYRLIDNFRMSLVGNRSSKAAPVAVVQGPELSKQPVNEVINSLVGALLANNKDQFIAVAGDKEKMKMLMDGMNSPAFENMDDSTRSETANRMAQKKKQEVQAAYENSIKFFQAGEKGFEIVWTDIAFSNQMGMDIADVHVYLRKGESYYSWPLNLVLAGDSWVFNFPQPVTKSGPEDKSKFKEGAYYIRYQP